MTTTHDEVHKLRSEVHQDLADIWSQIREGQKQIAALEVRQTDAITRQSKYIEEAEQRYASIQTELVNIEKKMTRNQSFIAGVVFVISGLWMVLTLGWNQIVGLFTGGH